MKKIILITAAVFAFGFVNAQDGGFKIGAHVGLPTGDIKDLSSVNLGVDAAYTWKVAKGFDAGITTGYTTYLAKSGYGDAVGFIPVAVTAQLTLMDNWFLGADLGYGIDVSNGDGGGFLYQPKLGYQMDNIGIYVAYKGISVDGGMTDSSVNLGVNFKL